MFVAEMDTEHFSFTALGETEAQAREAIFGGFRAHLMGQSDFHGADEADVDDYIVQAIAGGDEGDDPVDALTEYYGVRTVELEPGGAARDGTPVWPAEAAARYWEAYKAEMAATYGDDDV